jgi:hypothetical protein
MIGIEDFVIAEIQKMLDNDRYVERFKEILKDKLICLERGNGKRLSCSQKEA